MYEELVKRLREESEIERWLQPHSANETPKLLNDAADAIEGLSGLVDHYGGETGIKNLQEYASKYWDTLAKIPRWVSVSDRLPDNIDEEVLVCNEGYGKDGTGFATVAVYNGNGWLECWERKQYLACITHWMPLPEPPKEET